MPIYVLNVGYEIVLIFVESPVGGSDFIDEAQSVLDTIVWRDLN
jgi:hypothetical protein